MTAFRARSREGRIRRSRNWCTGPTILVRTCVQWLELPERKVDTSVSRQFARGSFGQTGPAPASRGAADGHAGEMTLVGQELNREFHPNSRLAFDQHLRLGASGRAWPAR